MPMEPADVLDLIRGHHIRGLSEKSQRILAASLSGSPHREMAMVLAYTEGAIRREFDRVQSLIPGPLGLRTDRALVRLWFDQHSACCCGAAKRLIENRIVFRIAPD